MAYNQFAYYYDILNGEADYDTLNVKIIEALRQNGIEDGIVADIGCGTGELTFRLAKAGYNMIGIDLSEEMLSVAMDKAYDLDMPGEVLFLKQDVLSLDLYGTIRAATCTFDTLNHVKDMAKAIYNIGSFMERGGIFAFDMNTPYKHKEVLGSNSFDIETEDTFCRWSNQYDEAAGSVRITLSVDCPETQEHFTESFEEYSYTLDEIKTALDKAGFDFVSVCDGESFAPLTDTSERYFICAKKRYTQLGDYND